MCYLSRAFLTVRLKLNYLCGTRHLSQPSIENIPTLNCLIADAALLWACARATIAHSLIDRQITSFTIYGLFACSLIVTILLIYE